jgi:hypothetical protein
MILELAGSLEESTVALGTLVGAYRGILPACVLSLGLEKQREE